MSVIIMWNRMKGYNGIYKFPENLMDSSMMSMNKSTEGGSLPGSVSDIGVIGVIKGFFRDRQLMFVVRL